MSKLREAAQAVLNDYDRGVSIVVTERVINRLRAALAQPETAEPVIGPEWTPCVKLPITVHVREQRPGEQHVSTREGITPVKPDDLIMRGVAGEEYPIGRELFAKTYRIGDKLPPDDAEPMAWAVECDGHLVDVYLTEIAAQLLMENMREANRGRDFAWRVVPLTRPPCDIEPPTKG